MPSSVSASAGSQLSPYNGIRLPWTVSATYLRGEKIADGAKVLAEPGTGRFVRPLPRQVIAGAEA